MASHLPGRREDCSIFAAGYPEHQIGPAGLAWSASQKELEWGLGEGSRPQTHRKLNMRAAPPSGQMAGSLSTCQDTHRCPVSREVAGTSRTFRPSQPPDKQLGSLRPDCFAC